MSVLVHVLAPSLKQALYAAANVGLGQSEMRVYSRPNDLRGLCDLTLHKVGDELPYEMTSEVEWMMRRGRAQVVVGLTAEHVAAARTARRVPRALETDVAEQVAATLAQSGALPSGRRVRPPVTTSAIAEAAKLLLDPRLHAVADTRTAAGLAKYGQTLDDNLKSEREKVAHLMQELLNAIQYALSRTDPELALELADMATKLLASVPGLTFKVLTFKERHSGAAAGTP